MVEGKDYVYDDDGYILVKRGSLDREYEKLMADFKQKTLQNPNSLAEVNQQRFVNKWNEKVEGNISKWEMDSLSFYYNKHELAHVNKEEYLISDFNTLPENPEVTEYYLGYIAGKDKPYWVGLCDIKDGCEFYTAEELINAKIYNGKSLFECWDNIRILSLEGVPLDEWIEYFEHC